MTDSKNNSYESTFLARTSIAANDGSQNFIEHRSIVCLLDHIDGDGGLV